MKAFPLIPHNSSTPLTQAYTSCNRRGSVPPYRPILRTPRVEIHAFLDRVWTASNTTSARKVTSFFLASDHNQA